MTIVTRTGDDGTTGLYGGSRVPKDHPRMEAIGTVDELNALLGCVLAEEDLPENVKEHLNHVQHLLFLVGADLATPLSTSNAKRVGAHHVAKLEEWIFAIEPTLTPLQWFILPGGSRAGALLHHARTVCRRAERCATSLHTSEPVNTDVLVFLNRLSDLLFVFARAVNHETGGGDIRVEYDA